MYFLLFSMKKLLFFLLEKYVFPFILLLFFCEICISFYFAFIFGKICISFYFAFIFCKMGISFHIAFIFSKIFLKMVSCLASLGLTQGDPDSRASDFLNLGPLNSSWPLLFWSSHLCGPYLASHKISKDLYLKRAQKIKTQSNQFYFEQMAYKNKKSDLKKAALRWRSLKNKMY